MGVPAVKRAFAYLKARLSPVYHSRAGRWIEFSAATLLLAAVCVYVATHDPSKNGVVTCVFRRLTGWYCPGCGLTRAAHALMHGDFRAMLTDHLFSPVVFAFLIWLYVSYFGRRLGLIRTPFAITWPDWVVYAILGAFFVYSVVRNIPAFSFLLPA